MPILQVIIASTRPGRKGAAIGAWFTELAQADGRFEVRVSDLAELDLPLMDEPNHPAMRDYQHDHTKAWSATVEEADAFVLVMPEYNHGYTAPLKNAIDYLVHEWAGKPVGFVSYGGLAGGVRAVELLLPVLVWLQMTPVKTAVHLPFFQQHLGDDGVFAPGEDSGKAATGMLDDLEQALARSGALQAG